MIKMLMTEIREFVTWGVTPGWLNPYIVGHYRLEVANDVFNGM
jgi:hypothetical protein